MEKDEHVLIKELLILYIDESLSPEVKVIVDDHLQHCESCKRELLLLLDDENEYEAFMKNEQAMIEMNSDDQQEPSFIIRLKRLTKTVAISSFILIAILAAASWILGRENGEEAIKNKIHEDELEYIRLDNDLNSLSPPRDEILAKSGVDVGVTKREFTESGSVITYRYTWDDPSIDFIREDIYWPNHLIAMDLTNNEIIKRKLNKNSLSSQEDEESWTLEGIQKNTEMIGIELPNFAVFYKPKSTVQYQIDSDGKTVINKPITINGVHFFIEHAIVTDADIKIYYRQEDPISKVGLYGLSFAIYDGEDNHWSKEPKIDFQASKQRVIKIPVYKGMIEPFTLHLEHTTLIVPGLHFKFSK